MIIVSLFGGLGNQLFQYACGKAVANKLGVELMLDDSILKYSNPEKSFTQRDFELDVFNIESKIADIKEVRKYVPNLYATSKYYHQLFRIKRLFNGRHFFIERSWQRHKYIPAIEKINDNTYLYGYFQTELFFKPIREEIINSLTMRPGIQLNDRNRIIIQQLEVENSVSIHVRRGDYINSIFTLLEMESYYKKAIEKIIKIIPSAKFYLFSNDKDWLEENFSSLGINYEIIDFNSGKQSYLDMILMSKCKHNIIANSSFSWWGAWLNQNSEKIVIAPKNWYKDKRETANLIPDEWFKI